MVAHTNLGAPQCAKRLAHLQVARCGAAACMSSMIARAQAAEGAVAA
jgi:hypothetical protein